MDANAIMTAISTVGFPIVCAIACMWFCSKLIERNEQDRKDERDRHDKEMESIRETINELKTVIEQNSMALIALKERLDDK
jgi:hypothetical protein